MARYKYRLSLKYNVHIQERLRVATRAGLRLLSGKRTRRVAVKYKLPGGAWLQCHAWLSGHNYLQPRVRLGLPAVPGVQHARLVAVLSLDKLVQLVQAGHLEVCMKLRRLPCRRLR